MISNETNTTNNLNNILGGLNISMAVVGAVPTQFLGKKGEIASAIIGVVQTTISSGITYSDSDFSSSKLEEIAAVALTAIIASEVLITMGIAAVPAAVAVAIVTTVTDDKIYDFYTQVQESFFQDIIEAMNSHTTDTNDNHTTIPSNTDVSDFMDQNDPFADPSATQDTIDIPIWGRYDPLVLDLNGDGVTSVSLDNSTAHFDLDGDGFAEKTGWIDGSDGFLVLDKNGNGKIDDVSELFGDQNINGFDALKEYDSNGDGVIDSSDDVYAQLQVWKDTNGDGLSSAGELLSMQEAGVASLNLSHTDTEVDNSGNVVTQVVVNNLEYTGKRDVS